MSHHLNNKNLDSAVDLFREMCNNNMIPNDINSRKLLSKTLSLDFSKIDIILPLYHKNKIDITPEHYLLIEKKFSQEKQHEKLFDLFLYLINKKKIIGSRSLKSLVKKFLKEEKEKCIIF